MDEGSGYFDTNLEELIRNTLGGEARLSDAKRESTLYLLASETVPVSKPEPFPHGVLVPAGVILLLSFLWLGAVVFRNGPQGAMDLPNVLLTLLVAVNFSCLPLSAALVLNRRADHVPAA